MSVIQPSLVAQARETNGGNGMSPLTSKSLGPDLTVTVGSRPHLYSYNVCLLAYGIFLTDDRTLKVISSPERLFDGFRTNDSSRS
jgi:hypothetical protein